MLLHAAVNNTSPIVPSQNTAGTEVFTLQATPVGWTTAAILWVVAAVLLVRLRGVHATSAPADVSER